MPLTKTPARDRLTKIVATLGPSSSDPATIRALFDAGVDVFRLNFSHGTPDDHRVRVAVLRAIEDEVGRPIAIIADLQGPKIRINTFHHGSLGLTEGQAFRLDSDPTPGDAHRVGLLHPEVFAALSAGQHLLLDDGKVRLEIKACGPDWADTIVLAGATLSDHKGVNLPGAVLPLSALTPKDRADLAFALDLGVDWVALSFVQRPDDVREAKDLIAGRAAVMAKLEKPSAIDGLVDILDLADGVMVARGDLGVEMPPEDVPRLQRLILNEARRRGKPAIVATQMLESMITSPTPTRAEASDVATAVYGGADAVMLSAETASGRYPLEAVRIMDRIIHRTQEDSTYFSDLDAHHPGGSGTSSEAITAAARQVAESIGAVAIVTYTSSGLTTALAARERSRVPVLGLTPDIALARRLVLMFGVHAVSTAAFPRFHDLVERAVAIAMDDGLAHHGQSVVVTAGVPFGKPGTTNIVRIARVDDPFNDQFLPKLP
jgi:pyruvate kinase